MFSKHRRLLAIAGPVAVAAALSLAPWGVSQATVKANVSRGASASTTALPVMTMKMNGKTISVGGALRSGGVRIVFTVTGEASGGPTLVRLDPGVTLGQFFSVLPAAASDPNNLYGVGQIAMSTQANKGTSSVQVNLRPGQYVALDLNAPAKTPPLTVFTVARAAHPAKLPAAAATITSFDFGFASPAKVHDGELIRFYNRGFVVHMAFWAEAPNLKTAQKIAALLKAGKDNQAQALAIGSYDFNGGLSHGEGFQAVMGLHPNYWVIACFMNTQDGREHTTLGMERVIQVVK